MSVNIDRICGLSLFVFCVFAWIGSNNIHSDAQMFPKAVIALLAICSALLSVGSFLKTRINIVKIYFDKKTKRTVIILCVILSYIIMIDFVGYVTSTIILCMLSPLFFGYRNVTFLVLSTAFFTIFVYILFVVLLGTPLPPELLAILWS